MNSPILPPPLLAHIPSPLKKKRVLLVDASSAKRDLRAETMRKLGMDVDCAADISEARSWWRADLYNLVLMNVENELGHRDKFCEDIRGAKPPQQVAFLVGKPEYLANAPHLEGSPSVQKNSDHVGQGEARVALGVDGGPPQRWGILEASRRISEVRSASAARFKAIRERPSPPRDLEMQRPKRTTESGPPDDLLREEMQ
jgi:CheY-like chemotaxis protein